MLVWLGLGFLGIALPTYRGVLGAQGMTMKMTSGVDDSDAHSSSLSIITDALEE